MSFTVEVSKVVSELVQMASKINPDSKHNTGRAVGEAFFWDQISALAKKRSDAAWSQLESMGIYIDKATATPGDHSLATTPHFTVMCRVSNPRRTFNADELATRLKKSKYKVPEPVTKEYVEAAKIPTNPTLTYLIAERDNK